MITDNIYGVTENYLPNHVCEDIIKRASELSIVEGTTGSGLNKELRDSRITWINDRWIFDWITPLVHEVNNFLNWNFNIVFPENIQFTRYRENQFYNWHTDNILGTTSDYHRKISVVIPLKDESEYEGGNLEFIDSSISPESKKEKIITKPEFRKKGTVVVFPSYTWHRVTKVTKGERLSIVIWYLGEKFK